jgi:hypothetical protein
MYRAGDRVILWLTEDGRARGGLDVFRDQDIGEVTRDSFSMHAMTRLFGRPTCTVTFKRDWPSSEDFSKT